MSEEAMNNEQESKKSNRAVRIILIIIAIIMIIVGAAWCGYYLYDHLNAGEDPVPMTTTAQQEISESKVNNPIDFKSLKKQNDEIYAWLKVPGTKVDHPVCQSTVADDFYLKHSAYDKNYQSNGAIYTQSLNTTTFKDRVTVIYGHNGYSDTMFTTLHKFEKEDFFNEHGEFYIYTPDSKLTYQIISAFKYDDRHLLNSFDMQNDVVFEQFLDIIQNPESSNKNVRTTLDKEITTNDNIVILSTCISHQSSSRYLICGVLVKNEATN